MKKLFVLSLCLFYLICLTGCSNTVKIEFIIDGESKFVETNKGSILNDSIVPISNKEKTFASIKIYLIEEKDNRTFCYITSEMLDMNIKGYLDSLKEKLKGTKVVSSAIQFKNDLNAELKNIGTDNDFVASMQQSFSAMKEIIASTNIGAIASGISTGFKAIGTVVSVSIKGAIVAIQGLGIALKTVGSVAKVASVPLRAMFKYFIFPYFKKFIFCLFILI